VRHKIPALIKTQNKPFRLEKQRKVSDSVAGGFWDGSLLEWFILAGIRLVDQIA